MSKLSKGQVEELKEKLLEEKERLKKNIESFAQKDPKTKGDWDSEFPDMDPGFQTEDELASEVEEYGNELATEHPLEDQLSDVDLALVKIEDGRYGVCENCKKEISLERLRVIPSARLCFNCAKKEERG